MAFANLFKTLSTAEEGPAIKQSPRPYKNGVQELCATTRPNLGEQQTGQKKKEKTHQRFNQASTAKTHRPPAFYDYDNPDRSPRLPAHFIHRERDHDAFLQRTMDRKVQQQKIQNTTFKQEMQQQNMVQKKKKKKKKKQRWQENGPSQSNNGGGPNGRQWHQADWRERFRSKGRGNTRMNANKMNPPAKRVRPMTQEFIGQNALEVDGRLLCKHFLWDRCTKGDECQLEHGNTVNDMIKEACKFYIQGCCAKGESCAYMHKYFHTRGKCSREADCRFSHKPLTDLTKQLLDQASQRDKDLSELAKRSQQESSAQPQTGGLEAPAEEESSSPKPDILLHPIRPHFYNSSYPEEPAHSEVKASTGAEQDRERAHVESTSLSRSPLPSDSKAVSYSVEMALGPMNSKPFPSLFGSGGDPPSSQTPPRAAVADHAEAPYSVDAVLRSVKTVGSSNSTCVREPPLSANPPLVYYGSAHPVVVSKPPWDLLKGAGLCLKPDTAESSDAKATPNGCQVVPSSNPDRKRAVHHLLMSGSVPPGSQGSGEVSGVVIDSSSGARVLPAQPETRPVKDTQKAFHSLFASPLNQNVLNYLDVKPIPSVTLPNLWHSTATALTNQKEKIASTDAATGHNTRALARPPTQNPAHRQSKDFAIAKPGVTSGSKPQSTESPGHSRQAKTNCRLSKPTHCDQPVLGCSKPVKRPHHNSAASSVTDSDEDLPPLQIATDLMSASSPEPGEAAGGVLHRLFATPLHETATPRASAQENPGPVRPRPVEGSSESHTENSGTVGPPTGSPGPKHPNQRGRRPRPSDRQPPTAAPRNDGGPARQGDSRRPEISSDKAPANAATAAGSVFKTLFLSLRPFCPEEERVIHSKSRGEDRVNRRSISTEQQRTEGREEETKRTETRSAEALRAVEPAGSRLHPDHQGSCEPTSQAAAPADHRPSVQNPHGRSSEPSDGLASGASAHVRLVSLGAGHPPLGPGGPVTRPHGPPAQSPVKQALKNLFKTLDPAASPFGSQRDSSSNDFLMITD